MPASKWPPALTPPATVTQPMPANWYACALSHAGDPGRTSWAAECIGLEHRVGTVEKSKLADLIVVDGV